MPPVLTQHYSSESQCTERSNYFWRKWNEPRCAQNHKRPLLVVLNLTKKLQMSFMLWWQIKSNTLRQVVSWNINSFSKNLTHLAVEAKLTKVKSCLMCEGQFREKSLWVSDNCNWGLGKTHPIVLFSRLFVIRHIIGSSHLPASFRCPVNNG